MASLKDEVSGVDACVSVRVECASGRIPQYILIGATTAVLGGGFESKILDARSLQRALHDNLPWPTYYALVRQMLIGCTKGDCFYERTMTPKIDGALNRLIRAFDCELQCGPQEAAPEPTPITKAEIRETLGWDKVTA